MFHYKLHSESASNSARSKLASFFMLLQSVAERHKSQATDSSSPSIVHINIMHVSMKNFPSFKGFLFDTCLSAAPRFYTLI